MPKSLINYAFDFISQQKEPTPFNKLWENVTLEAGLTAEEAASKVSRFYTNLLLDGRFITLGDNVWDLRTRHTFDKGHIDMRDVYSDVETTDIDTEEESEEKEYNEVFEEKEEVEEESPSEESEM